MLTRQRAEELTRDWIDAWNAHDLDRILAHYTDDFEITTPFIIKIVGDRSGTLKGKPAVRDYREQALARVPDLHFELKDVLVGVDSLTIIYLGVSGRRVAEVLFLDAQARVRRAVVHYDDV